MPPPTPGTTRGHTPTLITWAPAPATLGIQIRELHTDQMKSRTLEIVTEGLVYVTDSFDDK